VTSRRLKELLGNQGQALGVEAAAEVRKEVEAFLKAAAAGIGSSQRLLRLVLAAQCKL
jgi:hypothetical protein